ncbi:MAG: hypothetical protein C4539_14470 [Ignavibacteriales bacterium]|nr:MAG: hypothetical protein C4539_14470 [Ignavibacteriales bacterium]
MLWLLLFSSIHIIYRQIIKNIYYGGLVRKIILSIIVFVAFACQVYASGFQINESGSRAMGLGGAFVGLADDPSALYFNPAGVTQLSGLRFSIGATYIKPSSTFTGPSPSTTESKLKDRFFYPANFYASYEAGNDFWVGLAFNDPFGLGTEWEENWVGKYRTTKTEIRTFNFSPTVAYKINDQLSVAAGLTISYADVIIERKIPVVVQNNPLPDAHISLEGNATSFGFNLGVLYKPVQDFSVGLAFHSSVKYDMKGDATVTLGAGTPAAYQAAILSAMPKGSISAPLTVPYVATLGLAYHVNPGWVLVGDFQFNGWSTYDKLEVTFDDLPKGSSNPSVSERDFQNSFIARLGTEYVVNDPLALRFGVLYDKNPVKDERLDPTLPDADRIGLNIGIGYKFTESLSVDFAYFYLMFMERTIDNSQEAIILPNYSATVLNGKYNSNAHLIGLNINYNL